MTCVDLSEVRIPTSDPDFLNLRGSISKVGDTKSQGPPVAHDWVVGSKRTNEWARAQYNGQVESLCNFQEGTDVCMSTPDVLPRPGLVQCPGHVRL